ncbi:MAG: heme o synthase [Planctomycetes bacterium]|nr:heme o synthase [Planctomycetota bacterium]
MTAAPPVAIAKRARAYAELSKWRLSSLVLLTTAVGFVLGERGPLRLELLLWTLVGTALCAFGASALNQWAECPWDQRMDRTRTRPLPSGRVGRGEALVVSGLLLAGGGVALVAFANALAAALALTVAALYVVLYTPLKQRSSLCTQVGAVCGAIPPMIGWAAARGALDPGAWVLFAILFVWQIPHFLAIDWVHREDYARGGFRMISSVDPSGAMTGRLAVLYCLALVPLTLMAVVVGLGGYLYLAGALALGLAFLGLGAALHLTRTREAARRLFVASLVYLPLLLGLLVLDPTGPLV